MVKKNNMYPHHIFCVGDKTIPYARLCAMCIEKHCPPKLRANLKIYIHLDGLKSDADETAKWLSQVPCTEVTMGLFGIKPDVKVSGKYHQAMINTISEQFKNEPVLAFVDADCFLIDSSWHKAILKHNPSRHYSLIPGFKGETIAEHQGISYRKMRTTLFTLTPSLHNKICEQKFNKDWSAYSKLVTEFPEVHFPTLKKMDCMVTSSLKAQLLGYEIKPLRKAVKFTHIGGFSYMTIRKIQENIGRTDYLDRWLRRLRLNFKVLSFFEQLGWESKIDYSYAFSIRKMMQEAQSEPYLSNRLTTLPETSSEKKFRRHIEPLSAQFGRPES